MAMAPQQIMDYTQSDEPTLDEVAASLLEGTTPDPAEAGNSDDDQPGDDDGVIDNRDPAEAGGEIDDDGEDDLGEPLEDDDDEPEPLAADDDDDDEIHDIEIDDDVLVQVRVDGADEEVTLAKLKSAYSGETAIQKRLEDVSTSKKEAEAKMKQVDEMGQAAIGKLQQLDQILAQYAQPEPDWDALYAEDPDEWTRQREVHRTQNEQQAAIKAELDQLEGQRQKQKTEVLQTYVAEQALELRDKIPEFSDQVKGPAMHKAMVDYGIKEFGFTAEEINNVGDHRPLYMLYRLYKAEGKRVEEVVTKKRKRRIKPRITPGSGTRAPGSKSETKKRRERLIAKARLTGHPDDVAKTLLI